MCRPARAVAVILALAAAGCGATSRAGTPLPLPSSPSALPRASVSRAVVVVLENREYGDVIGDRSAPYVNGLARRYVLARNYHAIGHPSLPNYIALLAGDPLGISSDCTDCRAPGMALPDQLDQARVSWRAYMEGLPTPCFTGASGGGYAKKHNPFAYFDQLAKDPARCRSVASFNRLASDLRTGRLPRFAWITPNLCDDGHDCSNATVDGFLARLVPYLLDAVGPHGWLALVWDEGTTDSGCCRLAAGGRVPLILAGPRLRGPFDVPVSHYSLLGLIEDAFGVPRLRGAACRCTGSLAGAFSGGPRRLR